MKKIFTLFTMLCVVVGLHAETTFELSPATYKSFDSQDEVVEKDGEQVTITHYTWNFSSKSKDFTINCDKEWATAYYYRHSLYQYYHADFQHFERNLWPKQCAGTSFGVHG